MLKFIIIILILSLLSFFFYLKRKKNQKEYYTNLELYKLQNTNNKITEKILYNKPKILLLKNFLSKEECDYIIQLGEPHIKKSEVCGKNGSRPDKSRTSMTAHIGKKFITGNNPDKILLNVLQRTQNYCGLPSKNIEPIQLVRYEPGQYFKPHYDYLNTKNEMYKNNVEKNGQRKYTFFVYLTDVPDGVGGETYFPKINKYFKGNKGDAIFWDNILPNGEEDKMTLHSGTELLKGKKYGLNIWVRNKEYKG